MKISLTDASFAYNPEQLVFRDLSFQLDSGQIMSLIGPNGCGKTTLLKCLVGIRSFSGGLLELDGKAGPSDSDRTRLFGYVPQLAGDPVPYSVEQMVLLGRARFMGPFSRPDPQDIAIAETSMEMVGITRLADRGFHSLSGGERQLVLIAQALTTGATTLVFDEPTSALDLVNQHDTVDLLRRLSHDEGYTVIFSSHDPSHALHISDQCLLMDKTDGSRFGPAEEVITEAELRRVFGVESQVIRHERKGQGTSMGVLPILKPYFKKTGKAG